MVPIYMEIMKDFVETPLIFVPRIIFPQSDTSLLRAQSGVVNESAEGEKLIGGIGEYLIQRPIVKDSLTKSFPVIFSYRF